MKLALHGGREVLYGDSPQQKVAVLVFIDDITDDITLT